MLARAWSAVVRVPTTDGEAWFKEDPPSLAFEPALTAALAPRRPDILPEVIAFEGPRLLTRDAGSRTPHRAAGVVLSRLPARRAGACADVARHRAPARMSAELGDPVPAWLEIFDGIAAGTITLGEA